MAEDKVIPADIQADAKQLFPMFTWGNRSLILPPTAKKSAFGQKEEYEAYIQGRLDERNKKIDNENNYNYCSRCHGLMDYCEC